MPVVCLIEFIFQKLVVETSNSADFVVHLHERVMLLDRQTKRTIQFWLQSDYPCMQVVEVLVIQDIRLF